MKFVIVEKGKRMKKTVYFLIDCSGSMYGNRRDAVHTTMKKVVTDAIQ